MSERRGPLAGFIAYYVEAMKPAARALREEARRAGIHLPPSQLGQNEDGTSLVQPTDRMAVDVKQLKARLRDLDDEIREHMRPSRPSPVTDPEGYGRWDADRIKRTLDEDQAENGARLARLRVIAEALLDGAEDGDGDEQVIRRALIVLGKVEEVVFRELGHDWRGKIRPFGALTRRTGGGVEPLTLADAVELLAVDRAQFRREADESRTRAGESVAQSRDALQRAGEAYRQVQEVRRLLEEVLRPGATARRYCDDCTDLMSDEPCSAHEDVADEPALSVNLAVEVRRVIRLWREAQDEARQARRGRVSVYVDGQLVTGPPVAFEATLEAGDDTGSDSASAGEVVDLSEG